MCDPATAALVLSAASTVAAVYSQKQQADYQADVNRYNARQQENEATRVRNIGVEEENKQRQQTAELLSRQRAQLGAANVELTSGSPLQLQEDTLTLGEADALRIRSNYQAQAQALEESAGLTRNQAGAIEAGGRSTFAGSLLSAGGQVASSPVASKWFSPSSSAVTTGAVPLDLSKSMPNTFSSAGSLNLFGR